MFIAGAISPEDLIQYSHRISQASSVISPVGWQISKQKAKEREMISKFSFSSWLGDPRRPFPQDIEMRSGILGELTSGVKTHPPPSSTAEQGGAQQRGEGGGGVDILPPPEKKFAMAGRYMYM